MARFLVDESLPRAATRALVVKGHDALDARDAGLRGQPDDAVQRRAVKDGRVVVAADTDFANALRFPPGTHPGIVVLRVPDEWGSRRRSDRLVEAIDEVGPERIAGAIVIVEPARTRVFAPPTSER